MSGRTENRGDSLHRDTGTPFLLSNMTSPAAADPLVVAERAQTVSQHSLKSTCFFVLILPFQAIVLWQSFIFVLWVKKVMSDCIHIFVRNYKTPAQVTLLQGQGAARTSEVYETFIASKGELNQSAAPSRIFCLS